MDHSTPPSVSVVIPSYNASGTIRDAVATARAQTHRPLEIIVVDDASSDDTLQRLQEIAGPDLVIIPCEHNAGGGAARNRGIERAQGDLIAFLDADDLWAPHKLSTQLAMLGQYGGPAFCFSAVSFTNEYREQRVSPRRAPRQAESLADFMLKYGNLVQTSSILVPRPLLGRCRFTESLRRFQDIDFVLKLDAEGARAMYVAEPLVEWRTIGNPSRVSANASPAVMRAFLDHHASRLTFAQRLGLEIRSVNPAPGALGGLQWCGRVLLSVCTGALPALHAFSLLLKHSLGVRYFGAIRNSFACFTRVIRSRSAGRIALIAAALFALSSLGTHSRVIAADMQLTDAAQPTPYPERAQDWPGRGVIRVFEWMDDNRRHFWRERNKQQGSVVFAGDSLVANWKSVAEDFPALRVANRGIGGDVSRGLLFRFREDVLALNPKAVVILIGTNDLTAKQPAADTIANVDAMLRLRDVHHANLPVVLCTVPPSANDKAPVDAYQRARLNEGLRQLAATRQRVAVADLFAATTAEGGTPDAEVFKSDRLHLTSEGYARWKAALLPVLREQGVLSAREESE